MNYFRKIKSIAWLVLVFFLSASIVSPQAFASFWYLGGTFLGNTNVAAARTNTETRQEPANNPVPGCKTDPVLLHSGEEIYECQDLFIPGRGIDVDIRNRYRSGKNLNGQFGFGWTLNYFYRLKTLSNGSVVIHSGDGRTDEYQFQSGQYIPPAGFYESLIQETNGTWTLTKAQGEKWTFDLNGNLASIADRNGNQITFTYDSAGLLPIIGTPLFGQNSNRVVIAYDYRLTTITDTVGRAINFFYNTDGRLQRITDFTGRNVTFTYDPVTDDLLTITRPTTPQHPQGLVKTFTYSDHNLTTITDPKNQTFVTNHYDSEGRVQTQDLGAGSFQFDYSVPDRTTVIDRSGNVVRYDFNTTGNMIRKEEFTRGLRPGDPASFVTAYTYNSDMEMTSVTFPRGNGIKYVYDETNPAHRARGNLVEVRRKTDMQQPDNNTNNIVTTATYEVLFNQIKTITDPRGNVTTLTYDFEMPVGHIQYGIKGNLVTIQSPATAGGISTRQFLPNQYGQVTLTADPNGIFTQYDYFPTTGYLQRIIQDPGALNAVTAFTYDNFGNLDHVTDAENHMTDYDFNELGWLVQVKNPLNVRTKYSYDKNGNVEEIGRQANAGATSWQTTVLTYDILNKLKTITDPLTRLTTINYDNNENMISVVDAENHTTAYQYDERSLLFQVLDANAGVTQHDYDFNGNLKKITDANTHATDYAYDLFDRQLTTTYADTKFTEFEFDKNSNLKKVTQGKPTTPKVIEYDYDSLNRLTAKRFPATASLYQYDLGSRLNLIINPQQVVGYFYNNLNQILATGQIYGNNQLAVLFYSHDKVGNRRSVTYPSGKLVEYTYDANDRLDVVKVGGATLADYDWDLLDRRKEVREYLSPNVKTSTDYTFDLGNQLLQVKHTNAGGGVFAQFDYRQYDKVGNRKTLGITRPGATLNMAYGYNHIYELSQVTGSQSHTYQHDLVGNRTNVDNVVYQPNVVNQYTQVGPQAYTYSDSGNLTNDGVNAYTYDEENRLSSFSSLPSSANYTYDGLNRRVSKTLGGVATYFIYDGDREIEERNANGTLLADYVYGDSIDEVLTMSRGGSTHFHYSDGLGSVIALLDATGNVVESYDYDVYGQPTATSTVGNPYMFTGRRLDFESGIYYYRNRMYSPVIGRFLQRDPIGYVDSMNLFSYVKNNPINFVDPDGLITIPFLGWVDAGENQGQEALNYWAGKYSNANTWYEKLAYGVAGALSALWTPCTSDATTTILSIGLGIGRYEARPYWKYVNANTKDMTGPYLTRGWGRRAPYGNNWSLAKDKLQIPRIPSGVVPVRVPWYQPIVGRRATGNPQWGNGGGWEFYKGWRFPGNN